jgi:MoaA/NifB/PqqE/SkfB family radical SAM enzyme
VKIQTISFCTGDGECPNHCPYCVARATGKEGLDNMPGVINTWKVRKILNLARLSGVSTALITSKGATLYGKGREHAFQYIRVINDYGAIPFIEVQTSCTGLDDDLIHELSGVGVTTLALSCVSGELSDNRGIYSKDYRNVFEVAERAHSEGMMVRLCCTMCAGIVDTSAAMMNLIRACAISGIEQVSFVPVTAPDGMSIHDPVKRWVEKNGLNKDHVGQLYNNIRTTGTKLMTLMHGGEVYDIDGVSVCIRYCLTHDPETNMLRQVIVYPNGEARYSWTSKAARLMRGD